jgi:hypothetical protein
LSVTEIDVRLRVAVPDVKPMDVFSIGMEGAP